MGAVTTLLAVLASAGGAAGGELRGRVVDVFSREGISAAEVYLDSGDGVGTITDANGEFHFDDVPAGALLEIDCMNYIPRPKEVLVQDAVEVELWPRATLTNVQKIVAVLQRKAEEGSNLESELQLLVTAGLPQDVRNQLATGLAANLGIEPARAFVQLTDQAEGMGRMRSQPAQLAAPPRQKGPQQENTPPVQYEYNQEFGDAYEYDSAPQAWPESWQGPPLPESRTPQPR